MFAFKGDCILHVYHETTEDVHMGVSKNKGTLKWMVYKKESY